MEHSIVYYGERGIVNSIVALIDTDKPDVIKSFIESIVWLGEGRKNPVITDEITSVKILVEGTFGDWGAPDLMISVNNEYFFIIEAKAGCFVKNAYFGHQDDKHAYTTKNSSCINIQLGLRYRFIRQWNKALNANPEFDEIKESAYDEKDEAYETAKGRALKKDEAISVLKAFFGDKPLDTDKVFYVALVGGHSNIKGINKYLVSGLVQGDSDTGVNTPFFKQCGIIEYDELSENLIKGNKAYIQARESMKRETCKRCGKKCNE